MNASELEGFIRTRAIFLPATFDGTLCELSRLEPLRRRLGGARVVMLGETNHFVHEKSDFRLLLSRVLIPAGWSCFLEELGHSDGIRVDRYLRSGDERELQRLPSFGYTAHLRSDRDDRPGGILKSKSYPTEEFLSEQKRFYRGLRSEAARNAVQVHLAGIDIDGLPGGSYEDILEHIPTTAPKSHPFLEALRRVPSESIGAEADRLRRALRLLPRDWPREIGESVQALSESLEYIAMTYSAQSYDAVRPGMAFRENAMKRRVRQAGSRFPDGKIVLMAHALHLAKDDNSIKAGGVGPGGGLTSSLGHWLVQEEKEAVFSVWLIYGAGEDSQPLANLPRKADFPAHSLNALLARHEAPLLFFPPDAPELFRPPCVVAHMYNALIETSLLLQVDAVVFLPRVTPLRSA